MEKVKVTFAAFPQLAQAACYQFWIMLSMCSLTAWTARADVLPPADAAIMMVMANNKRGYHVLCDHVSSKYFMEISSFKENLEYC